MPLGERPMFDRWKKAGFEWTGRGWRPVHPVHTERRHGWRGREFTETGWYPEMVWWFRQKYDPRKESPREFLERRKPSHVEFLKKRGWDEESINLAWEEILLACAHKHRNFAKAVEDLEAAGKYYRKHKYRVKRKYFVKD
jgi:hypothetical protein